MNWFGQAVERRRVVRQSFQLSARPFRAKRMMCGFTPKHFKWENTLSEVCKHVSTVAMYHRNISYLCVTIYTQPDCYPTALPAPLECTAGYHGMRSTCIQYHAAQNDYSYGSFVLESTKTVIIVI